MSASLAANAPVPFRIPFTRGEEVAYVNPMDGSRHPARIRRVVRAAGATKALRYYAIDIAPGVLVGADRLRHTWEK